jgi:hypothetical protein
MGASSFFFSSFLRGMAQQQSVPGGLEVASGSTIEPGQSEADLGQLKLVLHELELRDEQPACPCSQK